MGATFSSESNDQPTDQNIAKIGTAVVPAEDVEYQDRNSNPHMPHRQLPEIDSRDGAPARRGKHDTIPKQKSKDTFKNVMTGHDPVANTIIIMFIIICVLLSLCMVAGRVCHNKEQVQQQQTNNVLNTFKRQQNMKKIINNVETAAIQPTQQTNVGGLGEYSSDLSF